MNLEIATQHVSMALRNNERYQIIKPLAGIGGQLRNCFYLVKDNQQPKTQKILNWSDFGPNKFLEDKTLQKSYFKAGRQRLQKVL